MRTPITLLAFGALSALLAACDQAISDRYGGLVVAPTDETPRIVIVDAPSNAVDLFEDGAPAPTDARRPPRRPATTQTPGSSDTNVVALNTVPTNQNPDFQPEPEVDETELLINQPVLDIAKPPRRPASVPRRFVAVAAVESSPFAGQELILHGERPDPFPRSYDALAAFQLNQEKLAASQAAELAARQAEEDARLAALASEEEARAREAEAIEIARLAAEEEARQEAARAAAAQAQAQADAAAAAAANQEDPETGLTVVAVANPMTDQSVFIPLMYDVNGAVNNSAELRFRFSDAGYDLGRVIAGSPVPALILQRLPDDLDEVGFEDRALMKELFIKAALPICLVSNARVLEERAYIERSQYVGEVAAAPDAILRGLGEKYNAQSMSELLRKVDAVPVSLCLAQAVHDSDWGRANHTIAQNGLFGQWAESRADETVIVPVRGRTDNSANNVLFETLQAAADSHILFLNRHPDLAAFRARRAEELSRGTLLDGSAGALQIDGFRPEEPDYGQRLIRLMRENQLEQYDLARLSATRTAVSVL